MRALISTYDKTGLDRLGPWLVAQGVEVWATGGTAETLRRLGVPVRDTSAVTGFVDLLEGRVKTLHPALYAALLARPTPDDARALAAAGIDPIDLVVVNLYPFRATWLAGRAEPELVEQIDIGGVSLLRAGAKNFERVTVLSDPRQYDEAMARGTAGWDRAWRKALAAAAFRLVAAYDADIAAALAPADEGWPERLVLTGDRFGDLRYGENPHQAAAFYRRPGGYGLADARLLQGKPLSYNNLADADTAWRLAFEFEEPACVAVKHQTPCGVARGRDAVEAYRRAREADPVSIFGGIVAFNRPVDAPVAEELTQIFLEVVIAPAVTEAARAVLAKKPNLRVLELGTPRGVEWDVRSLSGGWLVQEADRPTVSPEAWRRVAGPEVDAAGRGDLAFAWTVVRYVKSNAVCLARDGQTVGIGSGQTNRIDAVRQALERAGTRARGAVLASDAFFFPDTVEALAAAGVRAAVSPGGSVRDREVLAAAEAAGLSLWFTGERHFRH